MRASRIGPWLEHACTSVLRCGICLCACVSCMYIMIKYVCLRMPYFLSFFLQVCGLTIPLCAIGGSLD